MKKIFKFLVVFIFCVSIFNLNTYAATSETTIYVNLESLQISSDGTNYSSIKEYETLDDFLVDYNSNSLPEIYITNFLFDGVSSVKSPDLDDFIEADSNDAKIKTLEIRVINVNTTGNVELCGTSKGTMVAINTNNVKKDINLILNNVNIDTDSKKAPAIFVYNKETTYTDCKVTIKTKSGTKNYINGGKLKKVSLMGSDELENYSSNYNGDALSNYNKYTSYYGMYSSSQIDNILFATVKADSEDLQEGDPLYFYKGSGAISSDIDLYFEGEGYLEVSSKGKEGIETKGNLTFSGGTGDYVIYAYDDCLNTTTASSAGDNIRNDMVIDVNSLVAIVNDEGDEGDAIDSNGSLTINGGNIFAYAHSESQDAGLDSETGTIINGGTIIATGNMADMISNESKQSSIYVQFNSKIEANTLLVIKNQNDEIITAFKTDKDIQTLLYSSSNLEYESLKIYSNGTIEGEEENGLYTKVNSYTNGQEVTFSEISGTNNMGQPNFDSNNKENNFFLILFSIEAILLVIVLIYIFIDHKRKKK